MTTPNDLRQPEPPRPSSVTTDTTLPPNRCPICGEALIGNPRMCAEHGQPATPKPPDELFVKYMNDPAERSAFLAEYTKLAVEEATAAARAELSALRQERDDLLEERRDSLSKWHNIASYEAELTALRERLAAAEAELVSAQESNSIICRRLEAIATERDRLFSAMENICIQLSFGSGDYRSHQALLTARTALAPQKEPSDA